MIPNVALQSLCVMISENKSRTKTKDESLDIWILGREYFQIEGMSLKINRTKTEMEKQSFT